VKDGIATNTTLVKELNLLNKQLLKTGELTTTLFSAQSYDLDTISLFKEEVQINNFFQDELDILIQRYPEISFTFL
jgi:hypothetical protein